MRKTALALVGMLAFAATASAQVPVIVQELTGHDTGPQDQFGYSVEVRKHEGEMLALVGAPGTAGPETRGAGYVFGLDSTTSTFVESAQLNVLGVGVRHGEDVALLPPTSATGWLAVLGGGQVARLWRRAAGGIWEFVVRLLPPGNTFEYGGRAVGAARDAAGAEYVALSEGDSVYVFRRAPAAPDNPSGWLLDAGLTVAPQVLFFFGQQFAFWTGGDGAVRLACALSGNPRAVVVLARHPVSGTWAEEARLNGSAALPGNYFGYSLGASAASQGDVIVVGAPYRDPPYDHPGQAYVFRRDPSTGAWAEETRLFTVAPPAPFGYTVAVDSTLVMVNEGQRIRGFENATPGVWTETGSYQHYPEADDNSGLALASPYLIMGNAFDNTLGFQAGAAWVFTLPGWLTPSAPTPSPTGLQLLPPTPNPARQRVLLSYVLSAPGSAMLTIHDVLGREVWRHSEQSASAGSHNLSVDAGALAPAVYVLRLEAGGERAARRLVIAN